MQTSIRTVDVILFDLGNILVEIDFARVFAAWAAASGRSPQEIAARWSMDASYTAYERGELDENAWFASLRSSLGINLSGAEFLDGWNAVFCGPMPGAKDLLQNLMGKLPLYVFSNTNYVHERYFLAQYADLLHPIETVFTSCRLGRRKPDPEAFLQVVRECGHRAESMVFFDDLAENAAGACIAGLQGHAVSNVAEMRTILRDRYALAV